MKKKSAPSLLQSGTIPDLSSRELQAVCTIAEYNSFMAAALTLSISQPALTRMVQRVESALGLELFRRSTRRIETTPAGQEFIDLANRILSDLRISYENMRDISDEQRGRVIISSVMSAAYSQLPRLVASYLLSRPKIEIQLREGVHGTVMKDVRSGLADLGITYLDEVPREFATIELSTEGFHVVMPKQHRLACLDEIRIEDIADCTLVSLPKEAHARKLLDGAASLAGFSLHHAITVHQFATVMQCVRAGVGVSVVPSGAVPVAVSAGLISRPLVKPHFERSMGILTLKDRALTPSAKGFLTHLQSDWRIIEVGSMKAPLKQTGKKQVKHSN